MVHCFLILRFFMFKDSQWWNLQNDKNREPWYNIETTQAVLKHATVAPNNARKEYWTKIVDFFGASPPKTPLMIPIEAKFENPQSAYVAKYSDLWVNHWISPLSSHRGAPLNSALALTHWNKPYSWRSLIMPDKVPYATNSLKKVFCPTSCDTVSISLFSTPIKNTKG